MVIRKNLLFAFSVVTFLASCVVLHGCSTVTSQGGGPITPLTEGSIPLEWHGVYADGAAIYEATLTLKEPLVAGTAPVSLQLTEFSGGPRVRRSRAGLYTGNASFDAETQLLRLQANGFNITWCVASPREGIATIQSRGVTSVLKTGGVGKKLVSSVKSWMKSRTQTDRAGIFDFSIPPSEEERAWADHLAKSGRDGSSSSAVETWLVDPAFERAFGKPLREMTGPEARGKSREFAKTSRVIGTWEDPYPGYQVVYSLLRRLKSQDYVRAHAVHALSEWFRGMDLRLAALESDHRSFTSLKEQEDFASDTEAHLPTTFERSWRQRLEPRRREIANFLLTQHVKSLLTDPITEANLKTHSMWQNQIAQPVKWADEDTVRAYQQKMSEHIDTFLPQILEPYEFVNNPNLSGLDAVMAGNDWYRQFYGRFYHVEKQSAYQATLTNFQNHRRVHLREAQEVIINQILACQDKQSVDQLLQQYLIVPGDQSDISGRMFAQAAALRKDTIERMHRAGFKALAALTLQFVLGNIDGEEERATETVVAYVRDLFIESTVKDVSPELSLRERQAVRRLISAAFDMNINIAHLEIQRVRDEFINSLNEQYPEHGIPIHLVNVGIEFLSRHY